MTMKNQPRPGVWGDQARPGEIIRIEANGTQIFNLGATFVPITRANHKKRRAFRLE